MLPTPTNPVERSKQEEFYKIQIRKAWNYSDVQGNDYVDKKEIPYIMRFLGDAGVAPRVKVSVLQVETPLIVSADGAVLSLLNWRESVVTGLEVSVRLGFQVGSVTAVRAMHPENAELQFTSAVASSGEFVTNFTVAVLEHTDFVMLHKK